MKGIRNIKVCNSVFSKFMGLRFHKKITNSAFVFPFDKPQRVCLDMFFVHFKIDVCFLDKDKKILELKEGFRPYSSYCSKEKVSLVVEVPFGYVIKNKLKIGQKLDF